MPTPRIRYFPTVSRRTCAALLAVCALFAQSGSPAAKPWPGWQQYQVILWSMGSPASPTDWLDRIREAGFTAEECPAGTDCRRFVDAHLGFYVENMLSDLAFLHSREPIYKADWNAYANSRDRRDLVRKPCFDDPAFWDQISHRMASLTREQSGHHPLAYDLRDEPSLGSLASPMDYCFCPYTLRALRQWLQRQYPTLAALNQEWETSFSTWDDVMPLTTFEIKERERRALSGRRPENYAPWADHRAFMDFSFSNALDRLRSLVHQQDPKAPVGIGSRWSTSRTRKRPWESRAPRWRARGAATTSGVFRNPWIGSSPMTSPIAGAFSARSCHRGRRCFPLSSEKTSRNSRCRPGGSCSKATGERSCGTTTRAAPFKNPPRACPLPNAAAPCGRCSTKSAA